MSSITAVRTRIRSLMERNAGRPGNPDVVILAIDGIPHDLARAIWPHARTERMRSVVPTTSSSGWLSSLSGVAPAEHGVLGVVFRIPEAGPQPIDIFSYRGALSCPELGNIFSDAADLGYTPLALLGDLAAYDCAWRELLLCHSTQLPGRRLFTAPGGSGSRPARDDPLALSRLTLECVTECLAETAQRRPRLIWCFAEADSYIHRHGYDDYIVEFLRGIDEIGGTLAERAAVVVAHSDHGLTRTRHDTDISRLLALIERDYSCPMGGAGRIRWLYSNVSTHEALGDLLRQELPSTVNVCSADELLPAGSHWRTRIGEIVLLARDEPFVTSRGYNFDHGGISAAELDVPFSEWCS
jgi:hypothetical protein